MSSRGMTCIAAALLLFTSSAWAATATLEISQPVKATDNFYHERGRSIVYDGTDYWLFCGRSTTERGWRGERPGSAGATGRHQTNRR